MSIIYDALQKIQQTRDVKPYQLVIRETIMSKWWKVIISIFIVMMLMVSAAIFYQQIVNTSHQISRYLISSVNPYYKNMAQYTEQLFHVNKKPIVTVIQDNDYIKTHHLGGVFISDNLQAALINGKMTYLGHVVDGLRIIAIDRQSITLLNADHVLVLHINF